MSEQPLPPPSPPTPPRERLDAPEGDQQLAPRVVILWRAGAVIPMLILLVPAVVVAAVAGGALWLVPAAVLVLAGFTIGVLPPLRHRRWRWRVTDQALELEHGVVFRQVRALPYFRIQHIDVEHGPLDRWLTLARLEVHTASVTATLPGLDARVAPRLRTLLLQRAGQAVGDGDDDAV